MPRDGSMILSEGPRAQMPLHASAPATVIAQQCGAIFQASAPVFETRKTRLRAYQR
jgi:hypothetical protein